MTNAIETWIRQLNAFGDLATHDELNEFTELFKQLVDDAPKEDPAFLDAFLGVLERGQKQEDAWIFSLTDTFIDGFPEEVRAAALRRSVARKATRKGLELIGDTAEDQRTLEETLAGQALGSLEEVVRARLGLVDAQAEIPQAPSVARPQPGFDGTPAHQTITLRTLDRETMRQARQAAPYAYTVELATPDAVDAPTARMLLEEFPDADLPQSHPWFDFAFGVEFRPGDGEFAPEVAEIFGDRLAREVSASRAEQKLDFSDEVTPELVAFAQRRYFASPRAVELCPRKIDLQGVRLLDAAFPAAEFIADGALDLEGIEVLASRLVRLVCSHSLVPRLPALPVMRNLTIDWGFGAPADEKKALEAMDKIAALKTLTTLDLTGHLAAALPLLTDLPLESLNIDNGQVPPLDAKAVKAIGRLRALRVLSLRLPIAPEACPQLAGLAGSLESLEAKGGGDALLAAVGKLQRLKSLTANTSVTDAGVAHLRGLPLEVLRLEGARLGDQSLEVIASLQQLRDLNVTGAAFSDQALAKALERLAPLSALSLASVRGVGAKAWASAVRMPALKKLEWSTDAPIGKTAAGATLASRSLELVRLTGAVDEATFGELLEVKRAGKIRVFCEDLSQRQRTRWEAQ